MAQPVISQERLGQLLGWERVRQDLLGSRPLVDFQVCPDEERLDCISLLFNKQVTFLQRLGMGPWHYHPRDLDEGIELARKLVHHQLCLLEERDRFGGYRGTGLVHPGQCKQTLHKDAGWFRRIYFNRPPVREEIDFALYFEGKHIFIDRQRKEETERACRAAGVPVPEW